MWDSCHIPIVVFIGLITDELAGMKSRIAFGNPSPKIGMNFSSDPGSVDIRNPESNSGRESNQERGIKTQPYPRGFPLWTDHTVHEIKDP